MSKSYKARKTLIGFALALAGVFSSIALEANAASFAIDEMAMFLATMIYTQTRCGLRPNDTPISVVIANRGYDYRDFLPDGRYGNVVNVKLAKAYEFEKKAGRAVSCKATKDVVKRFLPELYR